VDLRKCFDKASAEIGVEILQQLGLPEAIGSTVLRFYAMHEKYFERDGVVAREGLRVCNSLLQGCPMSMILLAAQSVTWVRHVKASVPTAELGVYVDDRSLFCTGAKSVTNLVAATHAGDEVDRVLKWQKHPDKLRCYGKGKGVKKHLDRCADVLGPYCVDFVLLGVFRHHQ